MKILPINYSLNISNYLPLKNRQIQTKQVEILPQDKFELSFKGESAYLDEAKNISGIHCPTCGAKMLSQEAYDALVERAGRVESAQDFVELLKDYKDFVPRNMRNILRGVDNPGSFAGKSFREFYVDASKNATYRHRRHINIANAYLLKLSEDLPDEDKLKLQEAISNISPVEKSYFYREKLYPLIKSFGILNDLDQFLATKSAFAYVRNSCDYRGIFRIAGADDMNTQDLSKEVARRLFSHSLVTHAKISDTLPEDWVNNEVLMCKRCESVSSKNIFLNHGLFTDVEFETNLRTYLTDIAHLMGENKLPMNKSYISNMCNIVTSVSKKQIILTNDDVKDIMRVSYIAARHEAFEPAIQNKVDVPCAGCGSDMLSHDKKKEIDKALLHCRKPKDYIDVLVRYDKYLGEYSRGIADIMQNIYTKSPCITEEELYNKTLKNVDLVLESEAYDALRKYAKGRSYLIYNGTNKQLSVMNELYKRVEKYISDGHFKDYNYKKLAEICLDGIDLDNDCTKSTYIFLEDLKKVAYKYSLTQPNFISIRSEQKLLHTIVFNLFKSDVMTADHLDAMALGGDNSKYNIVGLCKGCNTLKGRKSINSWFSQILNVRKNFDRHLMFVDQMAKDGIITGFDDWAFNIAQKVYDATHKKFDMRYLFENKKGE